MKEKKQNDYLDSILYAAAKDCGNNEITEYNGETGDIVNTDELSERVMSAVRKGGERNTGRIGFKRFAAIAAAAAVLAAVFTVVSIAGRKNTSADAVISEAAGEYVLTYDLRGVNTGGKVKNIPGFPDEYEFIGKVINADGKEGECRQLGGRSYRFFVYELDGDYRRILGISGETDCFDFIVAGKYNGCAFIDSTHTDALTYCVFWNDGTNAYELYGNYGMEDICRVSGDLYR